jgi:hypothetical protein
MEIENYKKILEQEQKEKDNKEKLVAIAKLISNHPSRKETEKYSVLFILFLLVCSDHSLSAF